MSDQLAFEVIINQSYEQSMETVTAALKTQGFGILTRIDVQATMKEKLGIDFRPYAILGACNPPLAHKALEHAPEVGLLLPCNVTIEAVDGNQTLIRIANPGIMAQAANRPDDPVMHEIASTATEKILLVIEALKQA